MRVLLDSCVLFPAPLRDFLMHLTLLDVFEARWTNEIHDEWIRNLLEIRPDLTRNQLERTRQLMNLHARDCLVEAYEHLISKLKLPDPDDRHVLAAAIKCGANIILTFNLRDFPKRQLSEFGIAAMPPDDLISQLFSDNREDIRKAFDRQLTSLKNPRKSQAELLEILNAQGLPRTITLLASELQS